MNSDIVEMKTLLPFIYLVLSCGFTSAQKFYEYDLGTSLEVIKAENTLEQLELESKFYTVYIKYDKVMDEQCQVSKVFDGNDKLQSGSFEFREYTNEKYAYIYRKLIEKYGASTYTEPSAVIKDEMMRGWYISQVYIDLFIEDKNILLEYTGDTWLKILEEEKKYKESKY